MPSDRWQPIKAPRQCRQTIGTFIPWTDQINYWFSVDDGALLARVLTALPWRPRIRRVCTGTCWMAFRPVDGTIRNLSVIVVPGVCRSHRSSSRVTAPSASNTAGMADVLTSSLTLLSALFYWCPWCTHSMWGRGLCSWTAFLVYCLLQSNFSRHFTQI